MIVLDKLGTLQEQIFSTVAESFYSKHLSICHHRYKQFFLFLHNVLTIIGLIFGT